MMAMLRRILHGERGFGVVVAAGAMCLLFLAPVPMAQACWQTLLRECFDQNMSTLWVTASNMNVHWGIENIYYDTHVCPEDNQAAWACGFPPTDDPRYFPYPPNLNTYLVWGPMDLTRAQQATASFWMFNRSEPGRDSVFWGASLSPQLTDQNMMISGVYTGDMNTNWELKNMDFSELRTPAGDTISYLGQSAVYVFWRFRADADSNPPGNIPLRFGPIIDNVNIAMDDGGIDLQAINGTLFRMDGVPWVVPTAGDSAFARFNWRICTGGPQNYPPFRVMGVLDGDLVVLDTVISNVSQDSTLVLDTRPWVMTADSHRVRFVLDTLNQDNESNESNNVFVLTYYAYPEHVVDFRWVTPSDSAVYGDQSVTLRWDAYHNPSIPATLTFYSSTASSGCQGSTIPGGIALPVSDGPDSLVWDLSHYDYGVARHVFVRWHDEITVDSCIYSPAPVIRLDVPARPGNGIPDHFYLAQNSPNPFNPTTELEYGVAKGGRVTLRVFDVLGRDAGTLVNGERSPGIYRILFDGAKGPSGIYFYTLTTPEGTQTRKMMLLK